METRLKNLKGDLNDCKWTCIDYSRIVLDAILDHALTIAVSFWMLIWISPAVLKLSVTIHIVGKTMFHDLLHIFGETFPQEATPTGGATFGRYFIGPNKFLDGEGDTILYMNSG